MADAQTPLVTVFIPMLNEAGRIAACLDSVLGQRDLPGPLEVLVLDGGGADDSPAIVRAYGARHPGVHLLPNPDRFQAPAFNRALAAARGEFFVRMDAHTTYADDYVAQCINLLRTTGAASVGGPQRPAGTTAMGRAIAAAYTSRFAAGNAAFRYAEDERWVDTVYLGAWRTETLRRIGGMNPAWEVNEDYEMNIRLRAAGGRILLSPKIRSVYMVRPTLRALARQYFKYGMWRVRTWRAHPTSLRWRQLAPPALVLGLATSLAIAPWSAPLALVVPTAWALGAAASSVRAPCPPPLRLLLPFVFAAVHLAWGTGFLAGLARFAGVPQAPGPAPAGAEAPAAPA